MKLLHRKKKHFFSTRWNRMISLPFFFYVAVCVLFFFSLRHTYAQVVCHKNYTEQYTMGFFFFFFFYITYFFLITDWWINSCLCIRVKEKWIDYLREVLTRYCFTAKVFYLTYFCNYIVFPYKPKKFTFFILFYSTFVFFLFLRVHEPTQEQLLYSFFSTCIHHSVYLFIKKSRKIWSGFYPHMVFYRFNLIWNLLRSTLTIEIHPLIELILVYTPCQSTTAIRLIRMKKKLVLQNQQHHSYLFNKRIFFSNSNWLVFL
jgi:hypothetical protein